MHLELSLHMVFCNAVILACSSIQTVADLQNGDEEGADVVIADFDDHRDRFNAEGHPCQEAII